MAKPGTEIKKEDGAAGTQESEPERTKRLLRLFREKSLKLSREELISKAVEQGADITPIGQLVVETEPNTGRNPHARFIVKNQEEDEGDFPIKWGEVNKPVGQGQFDLLQAEMLAHLEERGETFIGNHSVVAPNPSVPSYGVEVISESASHQLFADNMFLPEQEDVAEKITILHAPSFEADPERHGTVGKEGVFIDFENATVLIVGTHYAGEIKKAIFTYLNYKLPMLGILPLHSSAGIHENGETQMFFGLSGTGKTTLSAMLEGLIGDDEHAWGEDGVVNFEGGCYAKVNGIKEDQEPDIFHATQQAGTILENVALDEEGNADYDSSETVSNARSSYPLGHLENREKSGFGDHPKNIFFLSFDARGVFPPLSKLTAEQAVAFFLQGYTSKVAGTELSSEEDSAGSEKDAGPETTFSACFGEPFLPLDPMVYAEMLREMIEKHGVNVWMVNTGYVGGPDENGDNKRVELAHTKALVKAVMDGELDDVETRESILGLQIPVSAPEGVPADILDPKAQWDDEEAFETQAEILRELFEKNYEERYR